MLKQKNCSDGNTGRGGHRLEKQQELTSYENIRYYKHDAIFEKFSDLPVSKIFAYANEEVYRIF
jgi:hypothetical protein